jgi:hypothetical protein
VDHSAAGFVRAEAWGRRTLDDPPIRHLPLAFRDFRSVLVDVEGVFAPGPVEVSHFAGDGVGRLDVEPLAGQQVDEAIVLIDDLHLADFEHHSAPSHEEAQIGLADFPIEDPVEPTARGLPFDRSVMIVAAERPPVGRGEVVDEPHELTEVEVPWIARRDVVPPPVTADFDHGLPPVGDGVAVHDVNLLALQCSLGPPARDVGIEGLHHARVVQHDRVAASAVVRAVGEGEVGVEEVLAIERGTFALCAPGQEEQRG